MTRLPALHARCVDFSYVVHRYDLLGTKHRNKNLKNLFKNILSYFIELLNLNN